MTPTDEPPAGPRSSDAARIVAEAATYLMTKLPAQPDVFVSLDGRQRDALDAIEGVVDVASDDVPGLIGPRDDAGGDVIRWGRVAGRSLLVHIGDRRPPRTGDVDAVTRPVDVAVALGCTTAIVTSVAAGLHPSFEVGSIMVVSDHLNLTGMTPRAPSHAHVAEHGSMHEAYDPTLRALATEVGEAALVDLRSGILAAVAAPAYQTRAEVRMLRALGADAVSTTGVVEAIVARVASLRVLSLATLAALLDREEVPTPGDDVARGVVPMLSRLLETIIERLPEPATP